MAHRRQHANAEAMSAFEDGGSDPAEDHLPSLPLLHPARVRRDLVVQALDRVRAPKTLKERSLHPDAQQGEGVLQALAEGSGGTGMRPFERPRQVLEKSLRARRVLRVPCLVQSALDAGAGALRQVPEHVSALVHGTPLDEPLPPPADRKRWLSQAERSGMTLKMSRIGPHPQGSCGNAGMGGCATCGHTPFWWHVS